MLEWTKYSAYGVPFALPAGDIDSDGDFDSTDVAGTTGAYDVRKDSELDGDVDFNDIYHAAGIAGAYQTLGRGVLTSPAIDNRRGYAGYESDPTFAGANGGGPAARTIYHVRHRVYDADVGRWTRRDLLGYSDGMSLYSYVQGLAIIGADPWGLACAAQRCGNVTAASSRAEARVPSACSAAQEPEEWIPIPSTPPWGPPRPKTIDPNWSDCQSACIFTAQVWKSACLTCTRGSWLKNKAWWQASCQSSAEAALKLCLAACIDHDTSFTAPTAMYNAMCQILKRCKAKLNCGSKWLPGLPLPPGMPNPPPGGPSPEATLGGVA